MSKAGETFEKLVSVIAKLRDPNGGCPWDLEQTHESLKPYLIEECYEMLEAIDKGPSTLREELGDVLLQVVLHAQVAKDNNTFTIDQVIETLTAKLIKRHPHVFGDTAVSSTKEVLENWEQIKKGEKSGKEGVLDSVPKQLPSLLRAQRMGEKAARVGFDWPDSRSVIDKIKEEIGEFEKASPNQRLEEFGDLLFALAQYARKLGLDSEIGLAQACDKFKRRFDAMEEYAKKKTGGDLKALSLKEQEQLWTEIKARE